MKGSSKGKNVPSPVVLPSAVINYKSTERTTNIGKVCVGLVQPHIFVANRTNGQGNL